MHKGYYVGRKPCNSQSERFVIVESRPFEPCSDSEDDQWRARRDALSWGLFIQSAHPKDDVFIFQVSSLKDFEDSLK